MPDFNFPIRINRYLALQGLCTRKEADELISAGKVKINGQIAKIGAKVESTDHVEVEKNTLTQRAKNKIYLAYYKPKGIVTHSPEEDQQAIEDILKLPRDVAPIGRLDRDSEGLIILSNDGRLSERLLSPRFPHEKEYLVKIDKPLSNLAAKHLVLGVKLEDGAKTKPAKIKEIQENLISITLTEGKKHQVRRMFAAFGYVVRNLKRVRIMNIKLGKLNSGEAREITGEELSNFLKSLKLA